MRDAIASSGTRSAHQERRLKEGMPWKEMNPRDADAPETQRALKTPRPARQPGERPERATALLWATSRRHRHFQTGALPRPADRAVLRAPIPARATRTTTWPCLLLRPARRGGPRGPRHRGSGVAVNALSLAVFERAKARAAHDPQARFRAGGSPPAPLHDAVEPDARSSAPPRPGRSRGRSRSRWCRRLVEERGRRSAGQRFRPVFAPVHEAAGRLRRGRRAPSHPLSERSCFSFQRRRRQGPKR